jgi:hypothetical protein
MASTAFGLIRPDGREPALNASTGPATCILANVSVIWLLFEFSTQAGPVRATFGHRGLPLH